MSSSLNVRSNEASEVAADLYTHYAKYVIETRALASAYDGMKAVQRRLIYVLSQMPDKLTKSANVVGDTIKYHPHGDRSIYSTLVGMASPNNNLKLIATKGNFGGPGVAAAAMRYTECKLSEFGRKMYTQLIDYADYVEGETGHKEPAYIPVLLPYSLVEGTAGIGVGLSASGFALNPVDLTKYYLSILKGTEPVIPRPELGELIINQPREEVEAVILTGRGRMKFQGVVHQESSTKFSIYNLPPQVKIKMVLKKVQRWIDQDMLDFIDESGKTRHYVFKIVSNKLDPAEVYKKLTQAVSRAKTYNFIFSEDEVAVYCGLGYVANKSLEYLRKCVVRKFEHEYKKANRAYVVLDAIEAFKKSGKLKDLPKMSRQEVIDIIVGLGFTEGVAKEVLSKSISYLTKDHGAEMEELKAKIEKFDNLRNNPDLYIIPLYEELQELLEELYADRAVTYYSSEKLDNPRAYINEDGNVQISKEEGVEWDSKLYLVEDTGMTYPRTVSTWTETVLSFSDITNPFMGLVSDKNKYLLYIIDAEGKNNHRLLAVELSKLKSSRNFVKLGENDKVVKVVGAETDVITLTTEDGKEVEVNVKANLKSRYAAPNGSDYRFKI